MRTALFALIVLASTGCAAMRSWATGLPPAIQVTADPAFDTKAIHGVVVTALLTETLTVAERQALGRRLVNQAEAALIGGGYEVHAGGLGHAYGIEEEAAAIESARLMGIAYLAVVTVPTLIEDYDLDWNTGRKTYRVRYAVTIRLIETSMATPAWTGSASGIAGIEGPGAAQQVAAEVTEATVKALPHH